MPKVRHGSRVKVLFEGKEVGIMTNFAPNEDYGQAPVYGIGHLTPQELVNQRFAGTFTFTSLLIEKAKIANLGYVKTSGKPVADVAKAILTQEGFTISIEDKYTGENIETYEGCKVGSRGLNVTENAILVRNGAGGYLSPASVE